LGNKVEKVKKSMKDAVKLVQKLGKMPSNILTPTRMVKECRRLHKNIHITDIGEEALTSMGASLITGVGKGSEEESHLIILEYVNNKNTYPIALVGKGVTFDSGGISLKAGKGMHEMKFDMLGAGSVMATMKSLAELNIPINVVGIIPTVENMPDGKAIKPGDVLKSLSGLTVETHNTDAEGRLILADALTYAQSFKPTKIISIATLTGASLYATGKYFTPVIGNNQELIEKIISAGDNIDDKCWQLPMTEEMEKEVKGTKGVADLKNISSKPGPGTITAAVFLNQFVKNYDWAHLDIATTGAQGDTPTGRGTKLLIEFLIEYAKERP
jgi:leucyl aminopeptidase